MAEITRGLAKAIKTQAAAFRPMVLVNMSIPMPRMNESISRIHLGVEKGSKSMK